MLLIHRTLYDEQKKGSPHSYLSLRRIISETIKVYDGYNSLRKRMFRTITVNKHCSKDELLLAAMRAFVVTQGPIA